MTEADFGRLVKQVTTSARGALGYERDTKRLGARLWRHLEVELRRSARRSELQREHMAWQLQDDAKKKKKQHRRKSSKLFKTNGLGDSWLTLTAKLRRDGERPHSRMLPSQPSAWALGTLHGTMRRDDVAGYFTKPNHGRRGTYASTGSSHRQQLQRHADAAVAEEGGGEGEGTKVHFAMASGEPLDAPLDAGAAEVALPVVLNPMLAPTDFASLATQSSTAEV